MQRALLALSAVLVAAAPPEDLKTRWDRANAARATVPARKGPLPAAQP